MGGLRDWWTGGSDSTKPADVANVTPAPTQPPVFNTMPSTSFLNVGGGPMLDQEQHQKWSTFIANKLEELSNPMYRQIQVMVDAMGNAIPAQTAYPTVFAGLKASGVTKTALIAAVKATSDALTQNAVTFAQKKEEQRATEVQALRDLAVEKQRQIEKLSQEAQQLNQQAAVAEQKINASILGYNTYHGQALAKIGNDLRSITTFIPD